MRIFKDNKPDVWAEEAVNWAIKNEILLGNGNGDYKLHDYCTREEMLVFIDRFSKLCK